VTLAELDRVRFARHLLLPEIGQSGQERLLAASVRASAAADTGALAVAREYLERAGVRVDGEGERTLVLPSEADVLALAGSPELVEAARALAGALAAVEVVKAVLQLGEPLSKAPGNLSSEEA
jgi:sulfur-carrier protein adenylyltransferase/sulfurtransferase